MWSKEFNIPIDRNGFIVDTINNFDEFDMVNHKASNFYWNYSIDKNYKIFFSKNGSKDNLKFNIWDIKDNVEVKINDKKFNNLKEWIVYDSKIRVKDVQSLIINNKDYTSIYKNIYKNLV